MIVTDQKYFLSNKLIAKNDLCLSRQKKKFDHVIIIDGDEGYGKTTFSLAVAYYFHHKTGGTFEDFYNCKNIFFDVDKMLDRASRETQKVYIWDEAALAALGSEHQSKIQKKLIKMLMVARKKGHFYIFNIPKIYKLNEYIAVDRSIFGLHVYSPDHLTRGSFTFYGKNAKERLYTDFKRMRRRTYKKYDFHDKFIDTSRLIDQDKYDKMKDAAIRSIFETEETMSRVELDNKKLKHLIYTQPYASKKEISNHFGVTRQTLHNWSKFGHLFDSNPRETVSNGQMSNGNILLVGVEE